MNHDTVLSLFGYPFHLAPLRLELSLLRGGELLHDHHHIQPGDRRVRPLLPWLERNEGHAGAAQVVGPG